MVRCDMPKVTLICQGQLELGTPGEEVTVYIIMS